MSSAIVSWDGGIFSQKRLCHKDKIGQKKNTKQCVNSSSLFVEKNLNVQLVSVILR
jgi:hypothetical protein